MSAKRRNTIGPTLRRAISAAWLCALLVSSFAAALAPAARAQPAQAGPGNDWCRDHPCEGARHDPLRANGEARRLLAEGDAAIAADENGEAGLEGALSSWQRAVDAGIWSGAQAALDAQKRMQMYTLSCFHTPASDTKLKDALNAGAALVATPVAQHALGSLGYYERPIDGQKSVTYRSAVRKFQRDIAHTDTGDLTYREFYFLICNAAQSARDADSQTTLALMYCAGVGVDHSPPWAQAWLNKASMRNYAEATLYVALLHGSGHNCAELNYDKADEFLSEAAEQGHPLAMRLVKLFPRRGDPAARWSRILADRDVREMLSLASWPFEDAAPTQGAARATPRTNAQAAAPLAAPAPQTTAARAIVKPRAKPAVTAAAASAPIALVPPASDISSPPTTAP